MPIVLALDLASVSGWAVGEPGAQPLHGSHRFASPGASHEAIFGNAMRWISKMLLEHRPDVIVWEAPLATGRRSTGADAATILYGLPAVIGAAAFLSKIYDCRKADVRDVRRRLLGRPAPPAPALSARFRGRRVAT